MGISVLMSVYKKEKPEYLKQALESIINQTRVPDEIVLIKDGPLTDELEKVIATTMLSHANFRIYQFEENVKLGRALRKGLALCHHELVARMDTDDIALPDRLEKQYAYMMAHEDVAAVGGFMEEFCEDEVLGIKSMPTGTENLRKYARFRNPLNHMTVMFRKSRIEEAGSYRHYPFLEDYDLWGRVLAKGYKIDNLPEVLVRARVSKDLYERRGGFEYCKRYLGLRKEQHKIGLTNWIEYVAACCITIAVTVISGDLRKQVYQKILRK